MEKYRGYIFMRILLSVGIILFGLNSLIYFFDSHKDTMKLVFTISLLVQLFVGIIVLCIRVEKKAYQYFIALVFIGCGVLTLIINSLLPFDSIMCWPLYLIMLSIFIFLVGLKKYKKIKFGYLIPSFALFCLGIFFSLFSFKIVRIPFETFIIVWGPLFLVFIGSFLVMFFLIQQRHKEFVFKEEDSGDFDDEELSYSKLD